LSGLQNNFPAHNKMDQNQQNIFQTRTAFITEPFLQYNPQLNTTEDCPMNMAWWFTDKSGHRALNATHRNKTDHNQLPKEVFMCINF
jgi:hypothetical protein